MNAANVSRALSRNVPMSPQKGRLVADQVRGKKIESALELLHFSRKKAAAIIRKTLNAAVANAEDGANADIDLLYVSRIEINEGIVLKRARFGARGRVSRINKRRSHVLIELSAMKAKGEA